MRYPAAETEARHARILAEAARLFRAHGFGGVNVAKVMQAAGLTHGAFYAHFDSKDALAAAATEQAMGEMLTHLERARGANDAEAAFVAGYLDPAHRDAPGSGCVIAALGPEVARHPGARGPFTAALRPFFGSTSGWISHGSPTMSPTVIRGFSDVYGSWKMIWICRRSRRSSFLPIPKTSRPR